MTGSVELLLRFDGFRPVDIDSVLFGSSLICPGTKETDESDERAKADGGNEDCRLSDTLSPSLERR